MYQWKAYDQSYPLESISESSEHLTFDPKSVLFWFWGFLVDFDVSLHTQLLKQQLFTLYFAKPEPQTMGKHFFLRTTLRELVMMS